MALLVVVAIASCIPPILYFLFMRNWVQKGDTTKQQLCNKALIAGLLSTFGVILGSGVCYIILGLIRHAVNMPALLYTFFYDWVVLALVEECVKFLFFKRFLNKNPHAYSRMDLIVYMSCVGLGFYFLEAIVYLVGANIGNMVMRVIQMGHLGYGFMVGYGYGKTLETGKKKYFVGAFLLAYILHGTYDFCLAENVMRATNEVSGGIALALAFAFMVTWILMIVFFVKKRDDETLRKPLAVFTEAGAAPEVNV